MSVLVYSVQINVLNCKQLLPLDKLISVTVSRCAFCAKYNLDSLILINNVHMYTVHVHVHVHVSTLYYNAHVIG